MRERRPGVWQVQFLVATKPRRRYRSVTVKGTRAEAEKVRGEMAARLTLGELDTAPDTLGGTLDAWADHHALLVAAATDATIRVGLRRVPDWLRRRKLRDVTPDDLRRWVVDLHRAGLASRTIGTTIVSVRAALEQAVADGHLRRNPAAGLRPPRPTKTARPLMADGDVGAALEAAEQQGPMVAALCRLVASTGCRPSDAIALQWGDINLDKKHLRFVRHVAGDGTVQPGGKTGRERGVDLDPLTVTALRSWHADLRKAHLAQGVRWSAKSWVFPRYSMPGPEPLRRQALGKHWARACADAGLDGRWTPRDLRHWHASTLVHSGVPVDVVAARLGHARVSTTLDVYGRHLGEDQAEAVEVMRRLGGEP